MTHGGGRAAETDSDKSLETAGGSKAAPGAQAASAKAVALAVPAGREGKPGKPPGWRSAAGTVAVAQRMQAATRDKALERMQARTLPASPCISRVSPLYLPYISSACRSGPTPSHLHLHLCSPSHLHLHLGSLWLCSSEYGSRLAMVPCYLRWQ